MDKLENKLPFTWETRKITLPTGVSTTKLCWTDNGTEINSWNDFFTRFKELGKDFEIPNKDAHSLPLRGNFLSEAQDAGFTLKADKNGFLCRFVKQNVQKGINYEKLLGQFKHAYAKTKVYEGVTKQEIQLPVPLSILNKQVGKDLLTLAKELKHVSTLGKFKIEVHKGNPQSKDAVIGVNILVTFTPETQLPEIEKVINAHIKKA